MTSSRGPIRVLHTLPDLDLGGGQVLLLRTIEAMRRLADAEHLVCALAGGVMLATFERAGVRTVILPPARGLSTPVRVRQVARLIRSERIDLVHTNSTWPEARVGQLAAAVMRRPTVNTFHAAMLPRPKLRLRSAARPEELIRAALSRGRERLALFLQARLLRLSTACIAVSSVAGSINARRYGIDPGCVHVIHPGLPPAAYEWVSADAAASLRRSLGVGGADPLILNIGRLEHGKGQHLLVPAMRRLLETRPAAHLLIAGEGEERSTLTRSIAEAGLGRAVTLLGHRSDVSHLLAASDLLVSASLCEGFGLVLLEAMAAAKPVVALHTPAYDDFTVDGRTAVMVREAEPDALAAAIERLGSDPRLRCDIGRRAAAAARAFSVDRCAARTLAVYRAVVERPGRHARPDRLPASLSSLASDDARPRTIPGRPGHAPATGLQ